MDFGRSQRSRTTFDHFRLPRINLYPFTRDNVTKECNLSQQKFTLTKLRKKLGILENLKNYPQMAHMIILTPRVYQNIIDEDNQKNQDTF